MMAGDNIPTPPAAPQPPGRWWIDALWLPLLAAWSAGWCFTAAPKLGVTYDEPFYLNAGMEAWRGLARVDKPRRLDHKYAVIHGVMPLPPDVVTIPLALHESETGQQLNAEQKIAMLRKARAMTLGWFWLLIFSAWRLGRGAGGPWAGRIASGLIAADPNFLAHSSLATTDIAVSATLMAFTRAVYAGRDGGWWKRVVLPGLWFGVAAVCKLSALLYGGFILVALEVCHRFATGALSRPAEATFGEWMRRAGAATIRSVLAAAGVIVIGIAVAVLFCGFPEEGERPFKELAAKVPPDEPLKPKYDEWGEEAGRVPHAVSAFAFQWWWNSRGRPAFLNGTYYPEAYRWFFPELILMKLPVPIFLLALVALPRPRAVANPLTLVALILLGVLLRANLQTGVRFALPVIAIGYVALATALARGYPRCAPAFALPAILAMAITSAWVWPHGLGYLNQLHGGLEAAPRRVSDSNIDWGQGLPELKEWYDANGKPPVVVWYFGVDDRYFKRLPDDHDRPFQWFHLERYRTPRGTPIMNGDDLREAVGPQILAVGYTVITLHSDAPPQKVAALEYLKTRKPLARTATFVLYDFRDQKNGPPPLD
jgi:hypothetical protein